VGCVRLNQTLFRCNYTWLQQKSNAIFEYTWLQQESNATFK
jgi:hypothetical protein